MRKRLPAVAGAALMVCASVRAVHAQVAAPPPAPLATASTAQAPASAAPGDTSFTVQNVTRAELWRFFEPGPGGGAHPDYAFVGNRSTLGARYSGPGWVMQGAIQYVRLENLPTGAIGPGLLGTGAAYFFQAAGTFSYQFYLRSLSLAWRAPRSGAWVETGRFSRAAAAEPASGDEAIDTLTRAHLNGRLLGDMEWSMYQRAWDGVRGGVAHPGWRATITAALPTQGTFEESANLPLDKVHVAAAEVRLEPGTLVPHTAFTAFSYAYDDTRRVTARPDNQPSSPSAPAAAPTRAEVRIGTAGASAVGAYPVAGGAVDALVWAAAQRGHWYGQPHRAWAAAGQAGYRLIHAPWQPWLRGGLDYASGDRSQLDGAHGTFFPMLPSGNQLSRSNTYALMNVVDAWGEVLAEPARALEAQAAVHRVRLASAADGWYTGSGATTRAGNFFGFQARQSSAARRLGTIVEGELTWRPAPWWTLRGYAGRMSGGEVVRNLFARDRLLTAWLESQFSF